MNKTDTKHRIPLRRKLCRLILIISVAAIFLTSAVGVVTMISIRDDTKSSMITSASESVYTAAENEAASAEAYLRRIADYVERYADCITAAYGDPERFGSNPVLPPDAADAGSYVMQLSLASRDTRREELEQEIELLGTLEWLWKPMMSAEGDLVASIYAATESGFMLTYDDSADVRAAAGGEYYDFFSTGWYTRGIASDGVFFTELYEDGFGRGRMISCGAPFYDGDRPAGVVCADFLLEDMVRSLISDVNSAAKMVLADGNGEVISAPDDFPYRTLTDRGSPLESVASDILQQNSGMVMLEDGFCCAYSRIGTTGWILCIGVPPEIVHAPADAMSAKIEKATQIYLLSYLVIIAAVFFSSRRFSAGLTKPLQQLQNDAEIISRGNLDHRAELQTDDEIGDLARSFNSMSQSLKSYIRDLTEVTAEKERISAELNIASAIQKAMLPSIDPEFANAAKYEIYADMVPAKEVGGDFYDFFMVDDTHLAVVMADVSGKGIPAALFMAIGKTLIKDHTRQDRQLSDVFREINAIISENNRENMFITCFEAILDTETGELRYVNAGHNPPMLRQEEGFTFMKVRPGFVLGGMEGTLYTEGSIRMEHGDELFLYTDGVTEATDTENSLFGEARMAASLNQGADLSMKELCSQLRSDVNSFVGEAPQFDDMTVLALKFK